MDSADCSGVSAGVVVVDGVRVCPCGAGGGNGDGRVQSVSDLAVASTEAALPRATAIDTRDSHAASRLSPVRAVSR